MRGRVWIYVLLFLGCTINYVDRVALSVAAGPISKEFGLTAVDLGYLFSAFLWTYVVCLIPWGAAVDRVGTRRVAAGGMAFWSLATVATGLTGGFASIFAARLAMGAGEASTYPAGGRVIREWIPSGERGLATVVFNSGGYAGPAFGAILVAAVVSVLGWRGGFVVAGLVGFGWLAVWLWWFQPPETSRFLGEPERALILRERPEAAPAGAGRGLLALLGCRSMWGLFLTQGCGVYAQYLFLTWMPSYLQQSRGLGILKTGAYTAVPYGLAVLGTIVAGVVSDRLLRGGAGAASGRRRGMVVGMLLLSSVVLLVPLVDNIAVILALFTVSLTGIASAVGLNIALLNDLLRDTADSGKANGFLIVGGNVFGILAPIVTGYVVGGTGSFAWAFVIAGVLLLCGALASLMLTRQPIEARPLPGRTVRPA